VEEQHQGQLDKLIAAQTRARINMEKSHTKSLKKLAKVGENTEVKQQEFKGELQTLLHEQEEQVRSRPQQAQFFFLNLGKKKEPGLIFFCCKNHSSMLVNYRQQNKGMRCNFVTALSCRIRCSVAVYLPLTPCGQ
jgi:hypothetical protein